MRSAANPFQDLGAGLVHPTPLTADVLFSRGTGDEPPFCKLVLALALPEGLPVGSTLITWCPWAYRLGFRGRRSDGYRIGKRALAASNMQVNNQKTLCNKKAARSELQERVPLPSYRRCK
eukprot:6456802-Amphidinium_carterae.1